MVCPPGCCRKVSRRGRATHPRTAQCHTSRGLTTYPKIGIKGIDRGKISPLRIIHMRNENTHNNYLTLSMTEMHIFKELEQFLQDYGALQPGEAIPVVLREQIKSGDYDHNITCACSIEN